MMQRIDLAMRRRWWHMHGCGETKAVRLRDPPLRFVLLRQHVY